MACCILSLLFLVFHFSQFSDASLFSPSLVGTHGLHDLTDLSHNLTDGAVFAESALYPSDMDNAGSSGIDACSYVLSHKDQYSTTSFKYLRFFFCTCKGASWLGYASLLSLLLLLFYLLGTTAADYFATTIEKLSDYFRLSPAVAGVTLLALGNGAPDVFSTVAAVVSSGAESLGMSSVLGGSIFVTMVVSGSVAIATASARPVKLDRYAFYRDIIFFLLSLAALAFIISDGKIVWAEALFLLCLYVLYGVMVVIVEVFLQRSERDVLLQPLLEDAVLPHVAMYAHRESFCKDQVEQSGFLWGKQAPVKRCVKFSYSYGFEWPLNLPRRLTIPIIEQHRWSRFYAVSSCVGAPLFLATLWYLNDRASVAAASMMVFGVTSLLAVALGCAAFLSTEYERPPKSFQFWWLAAGFLMSVVWIYIISQEVVAVLISLGTVLNIDPSILGITVLAWGNSVGDLVGNLAIAYNARDGVQMAMSGCYAGPMFNTVVGLGLASLLATWRSELSVSEDRRHLLCTIIFSMTGLTWTLITVSLSRMRMTRIFGFGLLFLYVCFMIVSLTLILK